MSSSPPPPPPGWQPRLQPFPPARRDCSDGLCSPFCPQWCDIFAAPPPPSFLVAGSGDDSSSSPALSPLVIAIIGVVAAAFLLVAYYTIVSRYCGGFGSFFGRAFGHSGTRHGRRRSRRPAGESHQPETWTAGQLSDGLEQGLINKITVCRYKRGDGFVDGTDCSVCLGEFHDGESLRVLPKCSHAFHIPCIDTWLKSHSNCPLCRCNIAPAAILAGPAPAPEEEVVVVIDDMGTVCEDGNGWEQKREVEVELEEEIVAARKQGLLASSIGTSRQPDGRVVRSLHCVAYPPEIKRVSAMSVADTS